MVWGEMCRVTFPLKLRLLLLPHIHLTTQGLPLPLQLPAQDADPQLHAFPLLLLQKIFPDQPTHDLQQSCLCYLLPILITRILNTHCATHYQYSVPIVLLTAHTHYPYTHYPLPLITGDLQSQCPLFSRLSTKGF